MLTSAATPQLIETSTVSCDGPTRGSGLKLLGDFRGCAGIGIWKCDREAIPGNPRGQRSVRQKRRTHEVCDTHDQLAA